MGHFFRKNLYSITTSCCLCTWELSNSSKKLPANLNIISFFKASVFSHPVQGVPKKSAFRNHSVIVKFELFYHWEFK